MSAVTSSRVIDLGVCLESRFPPSQAFEVEIDELALWQVVHERTELVATVWQQAGIGPERWDATASEVRLMKAKDDWHREGGRWVRSLSEITSTRDIARWTMPSIRRFEDLKSLGSALAGCLLWHSLTEQEDARRKQSAFDGALLVWRTRAYLHWRHLAERLLMKHRVQPRNMILRSSELVYGEGHPTPDAQCGFLIETWPMISRNLRFSEGFERIRARVLMRCWIDDVPEVQRNLFIAQAQQA